MQESLLHLKEKRAEYIKKLHKVTCKTILQTFFEKYKKNNINEFILDLETSLYPGEYEYYDLSKWYFIFLYFNEF